MKEFQFLCKSASLAVALRQCLHCLVFALSGAARTFEDKIVGAKRKKKKTYVTGIQNVFVGKKTIMNFSKFSML